MRDYKKMAREIIARVGPWEDMTYEELETAIADGLKEQDEQTQKELTQALLPVLIPYIDVDALKDSLRKAVKILEK